MWPASDWPPAIHHNFLVAVTVTVTKSSNTIARNQYAGLNIVVFKQTFLQLTDVWWWWWWCVPSSCWEHESF